MARFRNSNRHAANEMAHVHSADMRHRRTPLIETDLFAKLGYDHAMI